ncbi:MAG: hypothetical protein V4671_22740 [Armatimonadota bacterium]
MLDLNHPLTDPIFAAGGMEDVLLVNAQWMTLLPSDMRLLVLGDCLVVLDKLRLLNQEHFQASYFLFEAIDEMQAALESIAHLKGGAILVDKTDGEGNCAICETPIFKFGPIPNTDRVIVVCDKCIAPFMSALKKLESPKGFGTCFI